MLRNESMMEAQKRDKMLPTVFYDPKFEWRFLQPRFWGIWLFVFLLAICAILPRRLSRAIGAGLGDLFYKVNKKRRHIAKININMCFPELSEQEQYQFLRAHYRNYGQNIIDMGLIWWSPYKRLQKLTSIRGINHFMNRINNGENIILLTPHAAGLEYGGLYLSKLHPMVTMMNTLKNPMLNWLVTKGRLRFKGKIFLREMGLKSMVRAIKRQVTCYYIPDEDFGPELSVFVPFFGIQSATLPTLGRMAQMTNAAVLPVMTRYLPHGQGYEINILEPLKDFPTGDVVADAARMNQALEELVRLAPQQYMWTLKWFKTRPDEQPEPYL